MKEIKGAVVYLHELVLLLKFLLILSYLFHSITCKKIAKNIYLFMVFCTNKNSTLAQSQSITIELWTQYILAETKSSV